MRSAAESTANKEEARGFELKSAAVSLTVIPGTLKKLTYSSTASCGAWISERLSPRQKPPRQSSMIRLSG
ncbi:hypothetical protein AOLI_G00269160 [Acnodon oligacanthus]